MNKNKLSLVPVLSVATIVLAVSTLLLAYAHFVNPQTTGPAVSNPNDVSSTVPSNWTATFKDDNQCYSFSVTSKGTYTGDIKVYVQNALSLKTLDGVLDKNNSYNLPDSKGVVLGQMGVESRNSIYWKSSSNNVYLVDVNDLPHKDVKTCAGITPALTTLLSSLR